MSSSNSTTDITLLSSDLNPEFHLALIILSTIALLGSFIVVISKLIFVYVIPVAWKCCLLAQDTSALFLSLGVVLVTAFVGGASEGTCKAGGFFMLFGLMDTAFNLVLLGLTLTFIQNPSKMSQLSTFRYSIFLSIIVPQKVVATILVALTVSPIEYFDDSVDFYPLACFPVRQEGQKGATFGAILFFIIWTILVIAIILAIAVGVKFLNGPSTKIHASSPSLWQMQKMEQSKALHRHSLFEVLMAVVITFIVTIIIYTNSDFEHTPQWIALVSIALSASVRVVISTIQFVMWSSICCNESTQKKEPYHRLKHLELVRNEGSGKLRLKASWTAGRGMWKRGLLKVYGPAHIKAWAQEIVVLGLLRKSRSASVLQCLWTSNCNPYYETMTLISGDIVTGDSRLTCLELTSSGTLQDLLKNMDVPLPEPCQRTIMHDIAEGLSYLHDQNVLHRNITSSAIYLKGSVQCLVLRAAVGDFEDAQIYGTLLTGSPNSNVSRKRFFFPDIRAYALVGIEMLSRICECRQREKQPYRRTAIKVSSGLKNANTKNQDRLHHRHAHNHHHHHQHHRNYNTDPSVNVIEKDNAVELNNRGAIRYENQEVPYSVPGEAEMTPRSKSLARKGKISNQTSSTIAQSPSGSRVIGPNVSTPNPTQQIDQNWMLHPRPSTAPKDNQGGDAESLCKEYDACDSDRFNHSQAPGVTYAKEANMFEFPNHSVFNSASGEFNEDLDMIQEEIERNPIGLQGIKNKNYKHGGYVTSKTGDGREVFIPAVYKSKTSGANSSSGYGSASDIYVPGGKPFTADQNQTSVFKTTSAATISSFEDDILEVLPGMTEIDEKNKKGDRMLRELLKAKQDAKVELLIESYEERVRRGELRPDLEGLPIGVVFPKKNRQGSNTAVQEPSNLPHQIEMELALYDALDSRKDINSRSSKPTSPRPKTAQASMNAHLQQQFRPMSASNSSFLAWNARSSLKRSKARHALKRALSAKGLKNIQSFKSDMERGTRGKEVEMKYAGRANSAGSLRVIPQNQSLANDPTGVQMLSNHEENGPSSHQSYQAVPNTTPPSKSNKIAHVSPTLVKPTTANNITRKPSHKSRPAPPPPLVPPTSPNQMSSQNIDIKIPCGDNKYDENDEMHKEINDSSTSANPESSLSDSVTANQETETSTQSDHVLNIADQIETDMNNIIQGKPTDGIDGIPLPPGIRLLDSGFDSASVSSEESCLCAAAALQAVEEGYSCPSEAFSQGACSCACSNCIQESHGYHKGSSWTGSQDSESWSNSNSLSSYDTNMHRRKISSKRRESPMCVLAPDEQYPSPGRRNKQNVRHFYSPKRNRRNLGHTRGNYPSSTSETSSAASRRYRELIKKGVPLRVSVVSGDEETVDKENQSMPDKSNSDQNETDFMIKDNALYNNLNNKSFFDPENQNNFETIKALNNHSAQESGDFEDEDEDRYCQLSTLPSLEEIIKEIPDETGHYPEETKAFLNRPESDMSVKALQAVLSRHGSTTDGRQVQDAELIIDRIFSKQQGSSGNVTPGVSLHTGLQLDDDAIREIAMLPNKQSDSSDISDIAGLLAGMDSRHIRYCHSISSRVHLINLNELLPANAQAFEQLKTRLQISGGMGNIGNQLLDLIRMCWLYEVPPSTTAIVDQLTDHITETEL